MLEMVCQPGHIARQKSATSYGRQMTSKGYPHYVKHCRMLVCGECGSDLAMEYIASHSQIQDVWKVQAMKLPQPLNLLTSKEYRVAFPQMATPINCPVEGCLGRAARHTNLLLHLMNWQ